MTTIEKTPNIEKEPIKDSIKSEAQKQTEEPKEERKDEIKIEDKIMEPAIVQESERVIENDIIEPVEEINEIETPTETVVVDPESIDEPIIEEASVDPIVEESTIEEEIVPPVKKPRKEKPAPEKIDTSKVEKLTNLVSSIKTLIARGMMTEAQALIIE
jgi:hypothetical protein